MLKQLIRIAFIGVMILITVLAYLLISNLEKTYPLSSNTAVSLNFSKSPLSKEQLATELTQFAESNSIVLFKTVAGKTDFNHQRDIFVFGEDIGTASNNIEWLTFGQYGNLLPSSDLGNNDLSGSFAFSGDVSVGKALKEWATSRSTDISVVPLSWAALIDYTLVTSSAWTITSTSVALTVLACLVWFVLRARSRALRILNGQSNLLNWLEDTIPLINTLLWISALFVAGACSILIILGKLSQVPQFVQVQIVLSGCVFLLLVLTSLIVGFFTWPGLNSLGKRSVPERQFVGITEIFKIGSLALIALTLPSNLIAIDASRSAAVHNSKWEIFSSSAALRIRAVDEVFESRIAQIAAVARQADLDNAMGLSYGLDLSKDASTRNSEFDGLILVNQHFLSLAKDYAGAESDWPLNLTSLSESDLPMTVSTFLKASLPLWQAEGSGNSSGSFALLKPVGGADFPALKPVRGEMLLFKSPLLVVVNEPGTVLNDSFLAAAMTTTNVFFDQSWLGSHLLEMSASDLVLSVDSISDAGLYAAQSQLQSVMIQTLALILGILGCLLVIFTSSWIHVCTFSRRIFVMLANGRTWVQVFGTRYLAQLLLAFGFVATIWIVAPTYLAVGVAGGLIFISTEIGALYVTGKQNFSYQVNRKV